MPFSPCKHHITFVSGQVVPSLRGASLPDRPGRARQQAEASRTVGRCDQNRRRFTKMPPQSRAAQGFAGGAVEIDLIHKGIMTAKVSSMIFLL